MFKHMNIEVFMNKTKKIMQNPFGLSVLLLGVILFLTFIVFKPAYNNCDDFIMRTVADGTANPYLGPSSFLLFINTYYGEVLKYFYSINSNIYWYDIFFYVLMSMSVFICSFCIFKKDNIKFNIISFLTLLFVFIPLFISIQFTIVSGVLALTSIIFFCYLISTKTNPLKFVLSLVVILFLVIVSTLIRFHAFFAVALFGAILSGLFIKKNNIKNVFIILLTVVFGIFCSVILYENWQRDMKKIPEQKKCLDFNNAQVKLFNNTIAAENVFYPWLKPEKEIKNIDTILKNNGFTKGDYRLLLTWSYIGNDNIFNVDKLSNLVKDLGPKISLKNNYKIKFAVDDYRNVLRSYFLIMLCLLSFFPTKRSFKVASFITLYFIGFIIALNIPFRETPYRLWINFATLMPLIYLLYLKYYANNMFFEFDFWNQISVQKFDMKKLLGILFILLILLYCVIGFRPISKYVKYNNDLNKTQKIIKNNLQNLNTHKVYISDIYILEGVSFPFKNVLYSQKIKMLKFDLLHFPQEKDLLTRYNIPNQNTWDYICTTDNVEILTIEGGVYEDFFFNQIRLSVSKHMKDRYNKDVAFILSQEAGKLKSYKCIIMTKEDLEFAKKIKKANSYNGIIDLEEKINNGDF